MRYTTSEEPTIKTLCQRYHLGRTTLSHLLNDPDYNLTKPSLRFSYAQALVFYLDHVHERLLLEADTLTMHRIEKTVYSATKQYFSERHV